MTMTRFQLNAVGAALGGDADWVALDGEFMAGCKDLVDTEELTIEVAFESPSGGGPQDIFASHTFRFGEPETVRIDATGQVWARAFKGAHVSSTAVVLIGKGG